MDRTADVLRIPDEKNRKWNFKSAPARLDGDLKSLAAMLNNKAEGSVYFSVAGGETTTDLIVEYRALCFS